MTRVRDFIADLLIGSASVKEAKKLADNSFGDKCLKLRAISKIFKTIKEGKNTDDQRKFNRKKTTCTPALIAAVAAEVETDRRICINTLLGSMACQLGPFLRFYDKILGWLRRAQDGFPSC
jgi:hypothetical protein